MSEQFPDTGVLTTGTALAVAAILDQAARQIRETVGSSGIELADLGGQIAHVEHVADPDMLLAPADLAALLKINERTLRRLRNAGEIPKEILIGCMPRWRRGDVRHWLEAK
jgi:predicted DNA-binding transcriptional regulator AlpA